MVFASTSFATTAPAATTALSPMVTPRRIVAFEPTQTFRRLTGDNKELYIVPDANHTDLYDNMERIPFDRIESFFKENLR